MEPSDVGDFLAGLSLALVGLPLALVGVWAFVEAFVITHPIVRRPRVTGRGRRS